MLTDKEKKRYSRQLMLLEVGKEGQLKLRDAKVLVIGAGGLGCPVLLYLAASGVGTLGIIDDDVIDESNLQRQVLYNSDDVGLPKVKVAAGKLMKQNPHINIRVHQKKLEKENAAEVIRDYDLVVDGSDNFETRYLTNDTCVALGKPLVFGSILRHEGQVSVFNYKNGPTYRDLFPEPPDDMLSCGEAGVMAIIPGIVGMLQANEVIKIILDNKDVLSGKLFVIDAMTMETNTLKYFAGHPARNL